MKTTITIELAANAAPLVTVTPEAAAPLPRVNLDPMVETLFTLAGVDTDGASRVRPHSIDPRTAAGESVLEGLASFLSCVNDDIRSKAGMERLALALVTTLSGLIGSIDNDVNRHLPMLGKDMAGVRDAFYAYARAVEDQS